MAIDEKQILRILRKIGNHVSAAVLAQSLKLPEGWEDDIIYSGYAKMVKAGRGYRYEITHKGEEYRKELALKYPDVAMGRRTHLDDGEDSGRSQILEFVKSKTRCYKPTIDEFARAVAGWAVFRSEGNTKALPASYSEIYDYSHEASRLFFRSVKFAQDYFKTDEVFVWDQMLANPAPTSDKTRGESSEDIEVRELLYSLSFSGPGNPRILLTKTLERYKTNGQLWRDHFWLPNKSGIEALGKLTKEFDANDSEEDEFDIYDTLPKEVWSRRPEARQIA